MFHGGTLSLLLQGNLKFPCFSNEAALVEAKEQILALTFVVFISINPKKIIAFFTSKHQNFSFYTRSDMSSGVFHDNVVGLCSELLMRLFYNISLGYGKKFLSHMGNEPGSF